MLSRVQELERKLPAVRAALSDNRDVEQLRILLTGMKSLATCSRALDEWKLTIPLIKRSRLETVTLNEANMGCLLATAKTIAAWTIEDDKLQLKGAIADAQNAVTQIETLWRTAWKSAILDEFSGLSELARLLSEIEGGKSAAEKFKLAGALAAVINDQSTPRSGEREKLAQARKYREEGLELLKTSGADTQIVEFLAAVAQRTCTLALVTQHVLDWLKLNGQLERFRVVR